MPPRNPGLVLGVTEVEGDEPLWVVDKVDDEEIELDLGGDAAERVRGRLRLSDLKETPLGPLVEVEEEDGDQVLVWLE